MPIVKSGVNLKKEKNKMAEKQKKSGKTYYQKNRDKILAKKKKYYIEVAQ